MPLVIRTTGFEDYLDRSGGAFVKALVLGQADVGKTRSASFWPAPIFADCEKGRMSIADRGVPYAEIRSSADMDALIDMVELECKKSVENRRYQTFVLDTLDSYQRILIAERLRSERKEALSGWADWGYLDGKMTSLIERLMNLPMNILVNLHVKDVDGDDSGSHFSPKLKGDIRDQIPADFDLVGMMETSYEAIDGVRTKVRQIRWHSEPKYPMLKDRSGRLPRFTDVDFTTDDYYRIFSTIVGDFLEEMPQSTVVDELQVETDVDAAPSDLKGGPVGPAPAPKRVGKKAAATPVPGEVEVRDVVKTPSAPAKKAATPVPAQPVADPQPEATTASAEELIKERLGGELVGVNEQTGEVTEAAPVADGVKEASPEPQQAQPVCGDQPESRVGKSDPVPGCGKSLEGESKDRVNIAILRTGTYLCADCLAAWRAGSPAGK